MVNLLRNTCLLMIGVSYHGLPAQTGRDSVIKNGIRLGRGEIP